MSRNANENCSNCKLSKLIQAIIEGDKSTFIDLISDRRLINDLDSCGWTPLMHAVSSNNLEFVKILCERGATANIKDGHFRNPLMIASIKGFKDIVKFLLPKVSDLNAVDNHGMSAFMHAAKNGRLDIVTELFNKKVDVNLKDKIGFTAFMLASIEHHAEIVRFFQENKIDVDKKDKKMWNYYMNKILKTNLEMIKKLRQSGVQVSVVCDEEMREHPFIDLLQKSGCHLSFARDEGTRQTKMDLETLSEEHYHEPQLDDRDDQLSDQHDSSHYHDSGYAPQGLQPDEEAEAPVLRRSLQGECQTAVLDMSMPLSYATLEDRDSTEDMSDRDDQEATFNKFLEDNQGDLQFINLFENYREEFRNQTELPEMTRASGITLNENHFNAEDTAVCEKKYRNQTELPEMTRTSGITLNENHFNAEDTAVCEKKYRNQTELPEMTRASGITLKENHFNAEDTAVCEKKPSQGQPNKENAVHCPGTKIKQSTKGKHSRFKKIILNFNFKNFTLKPKKMKLNIEKCKNLTTGDHSQIIHNK